MLREDVMLQRMPHMRAQAGKAAAEVPTEWLIVRNVTWLPLQLSWCCSSMPWVLSAVTRPMSRASQLVALRY